MLRSQYDLEISFQLISMLRSQNVLLYILRTKPTSPLPVHFENEAYILVGRKFLNHIGWKEISKSSDDSDDHL